MTMIIPKLEVIEVDEQQCQKMFSECITVDVDKVIEFSGLNGESDESS